MDEDEVRDLSKRYEEVVDWLFGLHRYGSRPGLVNIRHLLDCMGDPHEGFKSIHVTGTNGKGTTTAMTASILKAAGYSVGMFTSPHLSSFTERIVVNGRRIPPEDVVRIVDEIRPHINEMVENTELRHPTFFEVITAIAFKYFSEQRVDFAVLEVGMGGKLDATNVVHALVSVITNVSLEHTHVLGSTVLEIAEKKAGVVKEGGVLVTATQDDAVYTLFKETCEKVGSKIFRVGEDITFKRLESSLDGQNFRLEGLSEDYEDLTIPLIGRHQLLNAATAVGAVQALKLDGIDIPRDAVKAGLRKVVWPGRMEVMQTRPLVLLDGAKDAEAARGIKETLLEEFPDRRRIAVVSVSSDKNIPEMIRHFSQATDYFIVTAHRVMGRAAKASVITEQIVEYSKPYEVEPDVRRAVNRAKKIAGEDGMVIVVGSVFLVGEAREIWFEPETPDPV
ncbi:MAG: bifunctional folylpolyglutamate synthase/dihydrofolate synthase [Candidatus Bathyarchaeota archaeon]|nr:MAG: bifunctional folylpolyglutamate synthase/dihydrofolate synthase [Candidatus Bathyarchaeota archaeon]